MSSNFINNIFKNQNRTIFWNLNIFIIKTFSNLKILLNIYIFLLSDCRIYLIKIYFKKWKILHYSNISLILIA